MLDRVSYYGKWLDKHAFLNIKIWDFSLRSLTRDYGYLFMRQILLAHPISAWRGLQQYRKFIGRGQDRQEILRFFNSEEVFARQREKVLLALGYCQKPLACPSGRFNHHCSYLEQLELPIKTAPLSDCQDCPVGVIGAKALRAGLNFNIMTSAADVTKDILLPSLNTKRHRSVILILCHYSADIIIFPLFISGLEGIVIRYSKGECKNYQKFILADKGCKNEQTSLSADNWCQLNQWLKQLIDTAAKPTWHKYQQQGNTFIPI